MALPEGLRQGLGMRARRVGVGLAIGAVTWLLAGCRSEGPTGGRVDVGAREHEDVSVQEDVSVHEDVSVLVDVHVHVDEDAGEHVDLNVDVSVDMNERVHVDAVNGHADLEPPVATSLAVSRSAGSLIEASGFPGISADGMHVAVLLGDPARGPLRMRVARIDGSVLLERTLLDEGDDVRERRLAQRLAPAQRVLDKARMRAIRPWSGPGIDPPVALDKDALRVSLPGFTAATLPVTTLSAAPCAQASIAELFADDEHGVVLARVQHRFDEPCDVPEHDWRVFALSPLP